MQPNPTDQFSNDDDSAFTKLLNSSNKNAPTVPKRRAFVDRDQQTTDDQGGAPNTIDSNRHNMYPNQLYQIECLSSLDQSINTILLRDNPAHHPRVDHMKGKVFPPFNPTSPMSNQDNDTFPSFNSELMPELQFTTAGGTNSNHHLDSMLNSAPAPPPFCDKNTLQEFSSDHGSLPLLRQQRTRTQTDNLLLPMNSSDQTSQSQRHTTNFLLSQYRTRNRQLVLENTNLASQLKLARRVAQTLRMANNSRLSYVRAMDKQNRGLIQKNHELMERVDRLEKEEVIRDQEAPSLSVPIQLPSKSSSADGLDFVSATLDRSSHPPSDPLVATVPDLVEVDPIHHHTTMLRLAETQFGLDNLSIRFGSLQDSYNALQAEMKLNQLTLSTQADQISQLSQRCRELQQNNDIATSKATNTITELIKQSTSLRDQLDLVTTQLNDSLSHNTTLSTESTEKLHVVLDQHAQLQTSLGASCKQISQLENQNASLSAHVEQLTISLEESVSKHQQILKLYHSLVQSSQAPTVLQVSEIDLSLSSSPIEAKNEFVLEGQLEQQHPHALAQSHIHITSLQGNAKAIQQELEDETNLLNVTIFKHNTQLSQVQFQLAQSELRYTSLQSERARAESHLKNERLRNTELLMAQSQTQISHKIKLEELTQHIATLQAQLDNHHLESQNKQLQFDTRLHSRNALLESSIQTINEWVSYCDDLKAELHSIKADIELGEAAHQKELDEYRLILKQCQELLQSYQHLHSRAKRSNSNVEDVVSEHANPIEGPPGPHRQPVSHPTLRFTGHLSHQQS